MMALLAAVVWIILLAITGQQTECFNLDQNDNVVRFFTGGNEPNSLFGFSLAPYSFSDNHTSILVGAPNERGSNDSRRTGAVYQCELDNNECSRVAPFDSYTDQQVRNTVPPGIDSSIFALEHDDSEIRVDGQLLGYSLDAVNDFAITCAPHYSMTVDPTRFNADNDLVNIPQYDGRCVVLQQNENISTPYTQFPFISILGPYTTTLRSFGTSVKLAATNNAMELFSSSLLSGSSDHPFGRLYTLTLDPLSSFSDSSNSRRTERGVNGYLGFHIEVGYITIERSSSDTPQVIASAPRDNLHRGSVSVWSDVYQTAVLSVAGEETDGYFGYDFAALSQAENGHDNLVVGCPLCSEERGAVYYYSNINGVLDAPVKIPAPNENQKGRFGISVESIGDLDRDGYNDVAIAAPLEVGQHDDGTYYTGVVYIFHSDSATSILTDYSQMVYGYSSAPLFGYSLSGGMDLDNNRYNDLVIGGVSTSSNSEITLVRAAPVVTVEAEIITLDEPLVLNDQSYQCVVEGETTVSCFNVTVCFNYSLLPGDSMESFKIMYTLSSDSRVFTNRSDINSESSISKEFTIVGENNNQCELHTVFLQPNIAQLTDIMFQLSIADSNDPLALPSGLHPVLNVGRTMEWTKSVELNSTCKGIICRPELELEVKYTGSTPVYLNERFNISFDISVTNNGVEDGLAFKVKVKLPYRGITKLTEIPHQEGSLQSSCVPSLTDSLVIECPIKSPIGVGEEISFELVLVQIVDDILLNTSKMRFDFNLTDEQNADTDSTNNVDFYSTEEVRSVAQYDTSITVGGTAPLVALPSSFLLNQFTRLTNIPTDPTELGPLLQIEIIVRNDDNSEAVNRNSPIPSSEVFIFWPSETTVQISGEDVPFPFIVPLPRQLQVQPPNNTLCMYHDLFPSSLSDEELANVSFPNATTPPSRELYPEYCDNIKCGVIICEVSDLKPDGNVVNVFINSVLFSPSVTGDQDVNVSVLVRNKGKHPVVEDTMETRTLTVKIAVPEVAEDCVNVWIPIVAAVGGFVILVAIAVLLGFLGFFTHQNRFKRYLEERRGVHTFDDDESYAPRIVVPDYEYEATGEPQLVSFGRRPPSCDGSIRDEPGISNGRISPFANGYNGRGNTMLEGKMDAVQLNMKTDHSTPSPHGVMMEYTDSDIITTTSSQKSLDKQPNNVTHPQLSSPTISISSKETEL